MARGRIYVANDNRVYAFNVPGQTVTPITLTNLAVLPGGAFQMSFTNIPGALFNVFGTTDLTQPFTNWPWLGEAAELSSGQYLFTDTQGPAQLRTLLSRHFPLIRTPVFLLLERSAILSAVARPSSAASSGGVPTPVPISQTRSAA